MTDDPVSGTNADRDALLVAALPHVAFDGWTAQAMRRGKGTSLWNAVEDVKTANPDGRNWFQLYMWKDRNRSMALVDRAAKAGYDTLLVTVDVPVAGARLRDKRNGFTIPPQLTARTVIDALPRPAWWFNLLTTEPLAFASLSRWSGTVADLLDTMFDSAVTYEDLAWIRSQWQARST